MLLKEKVLMQFLAMKADKDKNENAAILMIANCWISTLTSKLD